MPLLNDIKRHVILIVDHSTQIEPIVIEFLPSVIHTYTNRAVKEDCDVTGRVSKSQYTMNTVFYLK